MAYTYIKTGANAANGNTITFSPTSPGDFLLITSNTSAGGGNPTCTFTDNLSTVYSTAVATVNKGAFGDWVTIFYLPNCPSGITTLTATYNGGTPGTCILRVLEYSGIATSTPLIIAGVPAVQSSPGTATDAISTGNVNVSSQPALFFGWSLDSSQNGFASGTGYNSRASTTFGVWEDKRVTATGNNAATFTSVSHGTDQFISTALAFAESGGSADVFLGQAMM